MGIKKQFGFVAGHHKISSCRAQDHEKGHNFEHRSYYLSLIHISEPTTMRKATTLSIAVTTVFYLLCGCMGYAAFGDNAPGNLLTGFGFYNPYWLLDIANLAIVIHLVGAYQVLYYI